LAASDVAREPYRYIDDAADLGDAFADSPPDYTVDYDGTRPWIWRAEDGAYGERDYYYHSGADSPFLVRDRANAYAYDGGQLVVVYDSAGRPIDRGNAGRDAEIAAAYLARARHLYAAAVHNQRQAAYAADWEARRDAVLQSQRDWADQQRSNDDWRRWRADRDHSHQAALDQERAQRQADAAQAAGMIAGAIIPRRSDHGDDRGGDAPAQIAQARPQPAPAAARHQPDAAPPQPMQAAALRHPAEPVRPPQVQADAPRLPPEHARPQQAQAEAPRPQERTRPQQGQVDAPRRPPELARPQQAQADAARHPPEQAHPPQVRADAPRHPPKQAAQVPPAHPIQIPPPHTPPDRAEARQPQVRPAQAETTHRQPAPPSPSPAKPDAGRVPDPAHEHDKAKAP
jgi:hypothetical protein